MYTTCFFVGLHFTGIASSCRSALDLERHMKRNLWEALASFSATYHRMTSLLTSLSGSLWKGKRYNILFRGMWTHVWKRVEIGKKGAVFGVGFSQHYPTLSLQICFLWMSSWLLRAASLFCQGTPCSKDTDGVCEALLLEPSPWQKKMHWNPKSEWHIDMQHEICWPRHASCQEANAQRNVAIHVILSAIESFMWTHPRVKGNCLWLWGSSAWCAFLAR